MALFTSGLVLSIDEELTKDASMEDYEKSVVVSFRSLEIANSKSFKTEDEVQEVVDEICAAKNLESKIYWGNCLVRFRK